MTAVGISCFGGNCHGGFPTTEYENFRDFPSAAQDSMHVGGGMKSALKEQGAVFWEMTAVGISCFGGNDSKDIRMTARKSST